MKDENLLLAEYKYFTDAFWKNEEVGERRVNFFITLTTAIIAGIVALVTSEHTEAKDIQIREVVTVALSGTFLFGLVTFLRMLQRNHVTDEFKDIIDYLREQLRRRSSSLSEYDLPFRSSKDRLFRGGLAESIAVMNSFILAVIAALWLGEGWGWLAALAVFLVSAISQAVIARRGRAKKTPSQTFRAGVGAIIVDGEGKVLALERKGFSGAWQLPQGGLEVGEEPRKAVEREINEETGINEKDLERLSEEPPLLAYELPKSMRSKKTGRGQAQLWFLYRFKGSNLSITLGDKKEFQQWEWMPMEELVTRVKRSAPFRVAVYQELAKCFSPHLKKST